MFIRSYFEKCKQESNSHEVVLTLYGRLYYPQVNSRASLLEFARKELGDPNLTESCLEKIGAFQLSKHTKVFQDVYLKAGVVTIDSQRQNWDQMLVQLRHEFM
jgi:hypothetical protein